MQNFSMSSKVIWSIGLYSRLIGDPFPTNNLPRADRLEVGKPVSNQPHRLIHKVIGADRFLAGCPYGKYFHEISPHDKQRPIAASFANLKKQMAKLFGEKSTLVGDSTAERKGLQSREGMIELSG